MLHARHRRAAAQSVAAHRRPRRAVPLARARPARTGRRSTRSSPRPRAGLAPKAEPEVDTDHVAPIRASVRDAVETVLALLPDDGRDAASASSTLGVGAKLEVIVRFLAVLELFKQGVVDLEQVESFGELIVRPLAPGERVALDLDVARGVGRRTGDDRDRRRPRRRRRLERVEEHA